MRAIKFFSALFVLLLLHPMAAQTKLQKELDSLETALHSYDNTDTTRIFKTAAYLAKHSNSARQKFEALEKIAETYSRINNTNQSIAYLFQAKEVAEQSGDAQMMAQAYGSIANEYSYLNLTEKARPYLKRAIEQIERLPNGDKRHRLKGLSYLELGNLDMNDKRFVEANKNYKLSLQQLKLIQKRDDKNLYHYRRSLYNIGNSYYYLKQPDSAEFYLGKSLKIKDVKSPDLKYFIYSSLAEVYTLRGRHQQAIDTLEAALNDPGFDNKSLKMEMYLNLARNYKSIGDKTKYSLYNEKHLSLRDTVESHERKAINTAFNVEQQDISEDALASKQTSRWLAYAVFVVVLLSIGTIFYLNRKKKREHAIYLSIIEKLKSRVEMPLQTKTEAETEVESENEPDAKPNYSIPTLVEDEILGKLQKFEENEEFRNSKLTLSMLAVSLQTNPAYLSAVIKTHKDNNFNSYINELRIGYICRKIHDNREYVNYKISYLAEDCGFTSHSTFSTIFKKVTGISPSVFLSEEEKRHNSDWKNAV
ncbi:helix-turn-helix domain-containing protein [Flavobacterium sp.]|uniref:helix-turn-helix domain-containing protein n=1 Tax=Flavobacterium sp. TaxID=239 RepID=UPI0039E42711